MDFTSFLTSLGTSFLIFIVLMLLFTWLSRRPGNSVVYYPNRILKGLDPWEGGSRSRNPFAWIREAFSSSEQDVINMSALAILVLSGLFLLPVLLPVAATDDNLKTQKASGSNQTFSEIDNLLMGNVKAYVHVSVLRANALMAPGLKPEQFAVLVRDIPPSTEGQTRKNRLTRTFKSIYPETFYRSMVVTDNKEKLAHAEAVYDESRKTGKSKGLRPTTKIGTLGLVEHYNEKIKELIPKLEAEQKTLGETTACAFASSQQGAAASAAQINSRYCRSQDSAGSLPSSDCTHVFLHCCQVTLASPRRGIPSVGHAVRATSGKYFYFTVLNVFIGVTLGGTLFTTFKSIEKEPNSIVKLLASSLPGNASFFLTFVALNSRVVPLIIFHLKKKYLCKTEAELKQAWFPGDLGYATRIPGDMLVITIALCYSVIAPLIIPFGVVYFGLGWLVLRNQALKVYVPSFESYGDVPTSMRV
uniref:CSC1/OSCA1-like 7TM region domain-containing protein n=1 Tax=Salix viminalis TaxID=40686 RepID=A0A6N2M8G4_SALVM